jgi:hypothetical protein
MKKVDQRLAERLRSRGWTVVPPEGDKATEVGK